MYKNQLQELAQRTCFNLPSYTCIREGPDHAPRFKAVVNFNGETYESPSYCSTLRQAEHSAAEVALNALASCGPTNSLAAKILWDETGVYKNLLQEVSVRVGASLPAYTTFRTGQGRLPVFTGTVELVGVIFTGEPAKSKKQAEKNAAMAAWLSLKSLALQSETPFEKTHKDEQEHVTVARALQKYLIKARLARIPFPIKFPTIGPRPSSTQHSPATTSKILPLICPKTAQRHRPVTPATSNNSPSFPNAVNTFQNQPIFGVSPNESHSLTDKFMLRSHKFPAAGAPPYIPVRHCTPHNRIAPPVTVRNMVPVFSAPPLPSIQQSLVMRPPAFGVAPSVSVRQAVPVFSAPVSKELPIAHTAVKPEDPRMSRLTTAQVEEPPFCRVATVIAPIEAITRLYELRSPFGCKLLSVSAVPDPEVPAVQAGLPSSGTFTAQVISKAPDVENSIAVQDKPQESKEIEDLKHLKI
ncbi:hypothetical protein OROHE_008214 [Orobanche hederae]